MQQRIHFVINCIQVPDEVQKAKAAVARYWNFHSKVLHSPSCQWTELHGLIGATSESFRNKVNKWWFARVPTWAVKGRLLKTWSLNIHMLQGGGWKVRPELSPYGSKTYKLLLLLFICSPIYNSYGITYLQWKSQLVLHLHCIAAVIWRKYCLSYVTGTHTWYIIASFMCPNVIAS